MEKTPRMIASIIGIGTIIVATTGCAKNGQVLEVTNETNCWSMPGGADISRFQRNMAQENQVNRGNLAKGDLVVAVESANGSPNDGGFVQVLGNVHGDNPMTNEEIDLGQHTCWVEDSDLKKIK